MKDLVNNIVNKNAYSGTKVVISADAARFFIKKYARTHKKTAGRPQNLLRHTAEAVSQFISPPTHRKDF